MEAERCQVCDAALPAGARFCPSCGTNLHVEVIDVTERFASTDRTHRPRSDAHGAAHLLVPIGVAALLVLIAAVVFSSDPDGNPDETAAPTPTSDRSLPSADALAAAATPTGYPVGGPALTPRPWPTATPRPMLDPGDLSAVDATHLAVAVRSEILFLDLATGAWDRYDAPGYWPSHLPVQAFGDGVLLPRDHDALLVGVGGTTTVIGSGAPGSRVVGAGDGVVIVHNHAGAPREQSTITAYDGDGVELWTRELAPRDWMVEGVTSDGRAVAQTGGWVRLIDGEGEQDVGIGLGAGLIGDWVVLYVCETFGACSTELVHAITGERRQVAVEIPQVDPVSRTLSGSADGELTTLRLVGDELREVRTADFGATGSISREMHETSGVAARVSPEGLVIAGADGVERLLDVPTTQACCGAGAQVVFLRLDGR